MLVGEPGIGKSTLLERTVELADGFRGLRARGVQAESEIAFAGLQELFRPVVDRLPELPERQRAVLAGALAIGPPVSGDPLAVRAATLSLLAICRTPAGQRRNRGEAARGLERECRAHAGEADELAQVLHIGLQVPISSALGLLELGLGNITAAAEQLERCARSANASGLGCPPVVPYEPDLADALRAEGRERDAHAATERLQQRAERSQSPWGLATAARCRGMLADEQQFEAEFQTALALHQEPPTSFERARTKLCYGDRLRRARRRVDARAQLTSALATFERLGAAPWAERAGRELAATGPTARPRHDPTAVDRPTPQELRVALLIADGATIRDAALQLFLSPKTIEAHLTRAYRKLNVHNRARLARILTSHDPDHGV